MELIRVAVFEAGDKFLKFGCLFFVGEFSCVFGFHRLILKLIIITANYRQLYNHTSHKIEHNLRKTFPNRSNPPKEKLSTKI